MRRKLTAMLGLALVGMATVLATTLLRNRFRVFGRKRGDALPPISLQHLGGPDGWQGEQARLLIFHRPGCAHCRRVLETVRGVQAAAPDLFQPGCGVTVLTIQEPGETGDGLVEPTLPQLANYKDRDEALLRALGGRLVPLLVWIDTDRRILSFRVGEINKDDLEADLRRHLPVAPNPH